jgi:glycosyltransferase involved in cell wall biosynthesis
MRIGLVTDTYLPQVNGVTTVVRRMVETLHAHGHQAIILAPRYGERSPGDDGIVHRVPSVPYPPYPAIRLSLPVSRSATRFLDQARPELIHVATEGPLGLLGRRYALRRDLPLVTSFHTNFPQYSRHYGAGLLEPMVWRYLVWFHRPARLTQTPGQAVQRELVAHGLRQAVVWGRGVDCRQFTPARRDETLRLQLGVRPGQVLILHVGRLAFEKNLETMAEAWRLAREALGTEARFVVAGAGPGEKLIADRLPWAARLGFLSPDELGALYASADLCVLPSRTETCGLVALEAMASGLPVVAADAGGFRESVEHGRNGLLAQPEDARDFAQAIVTLARDPSRRAEMGREARRSALLRDSRIEDRELLACYAALVGGQSVEAACAA